MTESCELSGGWDLSDPVVRQAAQTKYLMKQGELIKKHGWTATAVFDPAGKSSSWIYTSGFTDMLRPELVVAGLKPTVAHSLLWSAFEEMKDGVRFEPGKKYPRIIDDFDAVFIMVEDVRDPEYPMTTTQHFYPNQFTALQLVWPDAEGRYPFDPGYDSNPQRLFGRWDPQ